MLGNFGVERGWGRAWRTVDWSPRLRAWWASGGAGKAVRRWDGAGVLGVGGLRCRGRGVSGGAEGWRFGVGWISGRVRGAGEDLGAGDFWRGIWWAGGCVWCFTPLLVGVGFLCSVFADGYGGVLGDPWGHSWGWGAAGWVGGGAGERSDAWWRFRWGSGGKSCLNRWVA